MEDTAPDDALARPRPCVRCSAPCLLSVVGRCADCIADLALRHPEDYGRWKADVADEFGRKG